MAFRSPFYITRRCATFIPQSFRNPVIPALTPSPSALRRYEDNLSPLVSQNDHQYVMQIRVGKRNTQFLLSYIDSSPKGAPGDRMVNGILREREEDAPHSEEELEWVRSNPHGVRHPFYKVVISLTPSHLGYKHAQRKTPEAVTITFLRFLALINHHLLRVSEGSPHSRMSFEEDEEGEESVHQSHKKHLPAQSLDPMSVYSKKMTRWPVPTSFDIFIGGAPIGGPGRAIVTELLTTSKEARLIRGLTRNLGDNTKIPLIGVRPKKRRRLN